MPKCQKKGTLCAMMTASGRPQLDLIVHNIRSAENVGAILRTADCVGARRLWITGYSPTPEHAKVKKTALGAEGMVEWIQRTDVHEVLGELRQDSYRIVGLEITPDAKSLTGYATPERTALLLGSEVGGLTPSLLAQCDDVVCIPQHGKKESLNVSVATGIASFWLLNASSV